MEFNDEDGAKYTITLDGTMNKNKILKIMEIVDVLDTNNSNEDLIKLSSDTSFGKLYQLIEKQFPLGSFNSSDILEAYEDEYKQPITLSTIATYLSRLEQKQLLIRQRTNSGWIYKMSRISNIQK
jgi:hypothetical protein